MYLMNHNSHPLYHSHRNYIPPPPHLINNSQGFNNGFPHGVPPPHFVRNGRVSYPHGIPAHGNSSSELGNHI